MRNLQQFDTLFDVGSVGVLVLLDVSLHNLLLLAPLLILLGEELLTDLTVQLVLVGGINPRLESRILCLQACDRLHVELVLVMVAMGVTRKMSARHD